MDIEITPKNRIKVFFSYIYSKAEDLLFLLICKIPDKLIPPSIMAWCKNYLNKRFEELQQEIIRQQWRQIYLEKTAEEIYMKKIIKKRLRKNLILSIDVLFFLI